MPRIPPSRMSRLVPPEDKQRNSSRARLLNHRTDILDISRLNHNVRRPSDIERGVFPQRSLEGHSPRSPATAARILPSSIAHDLLALVITRASSLHGIMRWGSIGPISRPDLPDVPCPQCDDEITRFQMWQHLIRERVFLSYKCHRRMAGRAHRLG